MHCGRNLSWVVHRWCLPSSKWKGWCRCFRFELGQQEHCTRTWTLTKTRKLWSFQFCMWDWYGFISGIEQNLTTELSNRYSEDHSHRYCVSICYCYNRIMLSSVEWICLLFNGTKKRFLVPALQPEIAQDKKSIYQISSQEYQIWAARQVVLCVKLSLATMELSCGKYDEFEMKQTRCHLS